MRFRGQDQALLQQAVQQNLLVQNNQNNALQFTNQPRAFSNAAAIGAVSLMGVLGVILSDNPAVKMGSMAFSAIGLLAGCALGNTQFGKQDFDASKFVWPVAVLTAAALGYACNTSISSQSR